MPLFWMMVLIPSHVYRGIQIFVKTIITESNWVNSSKLMDNCSGKMEKLLFVSVDLPCRTTHTQSYSGG